MNRLDPAKNTINRPKSGRDGFTMVELLFVIAIILILAAMGSFGWSTVKNRARIRIAENDCQHLALCTQGYYEVFGWWPASAAWNGLSWYTSYVASAQHVLRVDTNMYSTLVRYGAGGSYVRDPRFISGDLSEFNSQMVMVDPWNKPYMIRYDISETNAIPHPFKPGQMLRYGVIVWSPGPDGLYSNDANDPVNNDNIRSWSGD